MLVHMTENMDVKILISETTAKRIAAVSDQPVRDVFIISRKHGRLQRDKQGTVHFKADNTLVVHVMIGTSEQSALITESCHDASDILHPAAVAEDVIVRHFSHRRLGVIILEDTTLQRKIPDAVFLQRARHPCPFGIKEDQSAYRGRFCVLP